uniref:Uncharacterized protein n=1 Tax=Anguilla anguilla TaxID=7936 RepID=A0A0E9U8E7_ANGAN
MCVCLCMCVCTLMWFKNCRNPHIMIIVQIYSSFVEYTKIFRINFVHLINLFLYVVPIIYTLPKQPLLVMFSVFNFDCFET